MSSKAVVLFIFATLYLGEALSLKKLLTFADDDDDDEEKRMQKNGKAFCVFGICLSGKKDYEKSIVANTKENQEKEVEDLQRQQDELDSWKKEDDERRQLQAEEDRTKRQEQQDSIVAASCVCNWECGDRNDGTVCFRKCCNNEFGGPPAPPPTAPPPVLHVEPPPTPPPIQEKPTDPPMKAPTVAPLSWAKMTFWNPWMPTQKPGALAPGMPTAQPAAAAKAAPPMMYPDFGKMPWR